jgi:NAD+ synthase
MAKWTTLKCSEVIEIIIKWTKNYVSEAHANGVVIGLSGGIDSAVVAAIAVKAIGKDNVLGVMMPCSSSPEDAEDAKLVADWLKIRRTTIDLYDGFNRLSKDIWDHCGSWITELPDWQQRRNITSANIKSRLRMVTLMALANQMNYLSIGTTNKSEQMLGYFTKYGDGGVDFEPILDIFKTEVFEVAKALGVPDKIIARKPSPGLWAGQTTEGELGMLYSRIDEILMSQDIYFPGYKPKNDDEKRVVALVHKSWHKRRVPPHCSLSDWRFRK